MPDGLLLSILQETVSLFFLVFRYTWPLIVIYFIYNSFQNERRKSWVENTEHTILKIEIPKDNDKGPKSAEMMFASLHGILKDEAQKLKEGSLQEHLSIELVASLTSIDFYVWLPVYLKDYVESQVYAQYPSAEIFEVEDYTSQISVTGNAPDDCIAGCEIILEKDDLLPIKTFPNFEVDPLASITSTLSKLEDPDEQFWLQILISPESDTWQAEARAHVASIRTGARPATLANLIADFREMLITLPATLWQYALKAPDPPKPSSGPSLTKHQEAELSAIELKATKLAYNVNMRTLYLSKNNEKATHKLQAIVGSFKQFNTTLNGFKSTPIKHGKEPLREYKARFFTEGYILNIEELASIFHLPHISVETPHIKWITSKKAEPPADLPIQGSSDPQELTLFAQTNFRGVKHKFGIKKDDRRRHMYIIGKSGVGKSYALALLAISDIYAGHGACIIDPHGDLAEKVLKYIPKHRIKDVVYFNPSDTHYPLAFNPLECPDPNFKETIASGFVSIFKKQFGYSWGPRLEYVLRYSILALLDSPDSTMIGVIRMLTEKRFRQRVVKNIKDPVVKNFWEKEFATYNDRFQTEAVAPILNKVGQFIASPLIRNIVGQPVSTLNIRNIMDTQKILIINLSSGRIGEDNSALLGSMMITNIQLAAMSRADIPEEERKDFYLYVDEFQNFATDSFAKILSEARKYRLSLIVANQYIAQMEDTVKDAVFGNVGTLMTYRVGAKDSTMLESEFSKYFKATDFISLDNQHVYIKMLINGVTRQPFSAKILNLPPPKADYSSDIIAFVREKYSKPKAEVEELIKSLSSNPKDEEDMADEKTETQGSKSGFANKGSYRQNNSPKPEGSRYREETPTINSGYKPPNNFEYRPPKKEEENKSPQTTTEPKERIIAKKEESFTIRKDERPFVKHSVKQFHQKNNASSNYHKKDNFKHKNSINEDEIKKAIKEALNKKTINENTANDLKLKNQEPSNTPRPSQPQTHSHSNHQKQPAVSPEVLKQPQKDSFMEISPGETVSFDD
jgi:hypothetical protein